MANCWWRWFTSKICFRTFLDQLTEHIYSKRENTVLFCPVPIHALCHWIKKYKDWRKSRKQMREKGMEKCSQRMRANKSESLGKKPSFIDGHFLFFFWWKLAEHGDDFSMVFFRLWVYCTIECIYMHVTVARLPNWLIIIKYKTPTSKQTTSYEMEKFKFFFGEQKESPKRVREFENKHKNV